MTTSPRSSSVSSVVSAAQAVRAAKALLEEHKKTLELLQGYRSDTQRRGGDFMLISRHLHRMALSLDEFIKRFQEVETWVA